MSKLFTSRLLLTSDSDLLFYLEKHPPLYKLINSGNHIVSYDKLESVQTNFMNVGKYAVIVNTLHSDSSPQMTGHWTILLLEATPHNRNCMYIDSLVNNFKNNKHLSDTINQFCTKYKFKLHLWNTKTQRKNTSNCGFQIIFFLYYFYKHGIMGVYRLQTMLQQYDLATKEYYVLKKAYKLCKL